jgi:hypothetical protein
MPSTHRQSDALTSNMTPERVRTGIIVSVIVGTLALVILGYVVVKRRMNRGVKAGSRSSAGGGEANGGGKDDGGLEVGIVQEALPVYVKEMRDDEKRMAMEYATMTSNHIGPTTTQNPPRR